ncbi:hypothetical protein QTP70_006432 [Hemibagrus guttatus]|uniref:G-protein coupled receptors family 1 profile domain-containing protein n=1 Tax=Hemibagrus guttatus TaxID=175788 RepID=A0AAE0UIZ1_9TELE|nr:hypothetical protein QTP70_006432 [Hemibagrus guttatus]
MRESTALCYDSLNNSCPRTVYPLTLRLSLYFLFTTIFTLTMSGNLLVIFVIILSQNHLPTATNHLILSLSLAGVLIGGFVMPHSMMRSIETCWYFGLIFCEFHTTVDVVLCNTTVWHLSFISVDRYLAIFHPLRYRNLMTKKTGAAMITSSWGLALVFGFAIVISNPEVKIRKCAPYLSPASNPEVLSEYGRELPLAGSSRAGRDRAPPRNTSWGSTPGPPPRARSRLVRVVAVEVLSEGWVQDVGGVHP